MKFTAESAIDLLRGPHGLPGDGPEKIAVIIEQGEEEKKTLREIAIALADRLGSDCCTQIAGDHALSCPVVALSDVLDRGGPHPRSTQSEVSE